MNGRLVPYLWKKITFIPFSTKCSHEKAPLYPVEKFSIDLTVFFSKGTDVPPDVTKTRGLSED